MQVEDATGRRPGTNTDVNLCASEFPNFGGIFSEISENLPRILSKISLDRRGRHHSAVDERRQYRTISILHLSLVRKRVSRKSATT